VGSCLVLGGCRGGDGVEGRATTTSGGDRAGELTGKAKGARDAERDLERGVLKLKEYPPLPYSRAQIRYIRLLKERCGVEHEVLGPGDEQELRAEAAAYNGVMTGAIRQKFGADILAKLRAEADGP
jgi:hypothetical protein